MFQIDLVALGVVVVAVIAAFVRLEMKVAHLKEDQNNTKVNIEKINRDHKERDIAIWDKFDSVHSMLLNISTQLGKIEGKIDIHK